VQLTRPRKKPVQGRSRVTVDALLEATAHILVTEGYDKASTNKIAARAGVSVGSLYQYFPSKEALVAALAERHVEELMGVLFATAGDAPTNPIALVERIIRAMLQAHAVDPELHRVITEQIPLHVAGARFEAESERFVRALIEAHRDQLRDDLDVDLATFILIHAVESVTHAAVIERPKQLHDEKLAKELVWLVTSYLGL
jgi:AcrR family transcriptional regulator